MKSKYIDLRNKKDLDLLKKPAECIQRGGIVIFPTETVYGIGANALNDKAVRKIFKAKGRASDNPLIVHISNTDMLNNLVKKVSKLEEKLIKEFWPGPLTIIFDKKEIIPDIVSANLDTVGVRMPENEIARKFIEYSENPIAAPSANISGKPSGTKIEDIIEELDGKVDYIIDAGMVDIGVESTVIRVIDDTVHILRPGKITPEDIKKITQNIEIDKHVLEKYISKEIVMSPGMKYRHYAPNTKCILVYSKNNKEKIKYINNLIKENKNSLVLCTTSNLNKYNTENKLNMGENLEEITKNIFTLLRKVDSYNKDLVIIEGVDKKGLGLAIMNRLIRACEYNYIEI